ncbi:MAG TPA: LPS export ABC transporter permease LptG [Thermodesulfobacteriota bacterium]
MTGILARYVGREYLRYLFLALVGFIVVYFVVDFFDRVGRFVQKDVPAKIVAEYFLARVPASAVQVMPIALLLASQLSLLVLARNNEIVAMRACGVSPGVVVLPLLGLAAIASLGTLALSELVVPPASARALAIERRYLDRPPSGLPERQRNVWYRADRSIYYISSVDRRENRLVDVTVFTFDDAFNLVRRVDAAEARYVGPDWEFRNVVERSFGPDGQVTTVQHEQARMPLPETPSQIARGQRELDAMSYAELKRNVEQLEARGYDVARYRTDLHSKLALPAAGIVMTLLGIPLALRVGREGGTALGVVLTLALGFAFWVAISIGLAFGRSGVLPPAVAAWGPNVAFFLAGGYLFTAVRH